MPDATRPVPHAAAMVTSILKNVHSRARTTKRRQDAKARQHTRRQGRPERYNVSAIHTLAEVGDS